MNMHNFINSIAIAIVAGVCLMNATNIKSAMNVIERQNQVLMQMATALPPESSEEANV